MVYMFHYIKTMDLRVYISYNISMLCFFIILTRADLIKENEYAKFYETIARIKRGDNNKDQGKVSKNYFENEEMVENFIEEMRETRPFGCLREGCSMATNRIFSVKEHVNKKHPELIGTRAYKNHFENYKKIKEKRPFGCPKDGCSMSFTEGPITTSYNEIFHVNEHVKKKHPELIGTQAYKNHFKMLKNLKPFSCPVICCYRIFSNAKRLKMHILKDHLKQLPLHQTVLDGSPEYSDAQQSDLTNKGKRKEKEKTNSYQGDEPEKYFKNEEMLNSYMEKLKEERPFGCIDPNCSMFFKEISVLKKHINARHPELIDTEVYKSLFKMLKEKKPFSCPESGCRRTYNDTYNLRMHILKDHLKQLPPHQTGLDQDAESSGARASQLTEKRRCMMENETNSDQGEQREKYIKNEEMLNSYIEKLKEERPFGCIDQNCPKTYNEISLLKKHVNARHPQLIGTEVYQSHFNMLKDKKLFSCPETRCDKKCSHVYNLRMHILKDHLKQLPPHKTLLDKKASRLTEKRRCTMENESPRHIMQSMLESFDSQYPELSTAGASEQEHHIDEDFTLDYLPYNEEA